MALQNLPFTIDEYRTRLARTQEAMAARKLDALLLNHRADVCYVTGIETCYMVAYHAAVVPAAGDPFIVASDFEMLNARITAWTEDRVTFPVRGGDAIEATCAALRKRGLAKQRIGIQPSALTEERYHRIRKLLPGADLTDADDLMFPLKAVKSPAEIAYLRTAGRLTAEAMYAAIAEIAPGKTDNDVAARAYDVIARGGSEYMCIDPIVTVGERSGVPHTSFRRTAISPGDPVLIEIGACVCRYSTPMMRTPIVEPAAGPAREAVDACTAALDEVIRGMKPGVPGREIAAKAKAAWQPFCEELVWHGCYAYSVGIGFPPDWNDAPVFVAEDADTVLEPGMCFHATTSLRKPGEYGAAKSETVLVTETGCEVLTTLEPRP
jgi:Xaa-Pro dipeptidase